MKALLIFLFFPLLLFSANSQIPFSLSYYESIQKLTLHTIKDKEFILLQKNTLNKGLGKKSYWLKIKINNPSSKTKNYVLELKNPTLNFVSFFSETKTIHTGDNLPNNTKEIDSINFAFNLKLRANQSSVYYINIHTNHAVTIPISIVEKKIFYKTEKQQFQFLYLFLGFMLALIIYNAYLYLFLREEPHLYYVLFQFFYLGLLLSMSGLGYNSLWIDNIQMNEFILIFFDDFALMFFMAFLLSFLQTNIHFPKLYLWANLSIVMLIILSISWGSIHSFLVKPVMLSAILLSLSIVLLSVKNHILYAKYILIGTTFLVIGALSSLFKNFGWIDINFFTTWSIYFSALIEGMLFSLVLAKQIETLKEKEKTLISEQKEMLEKEVQKQTISLQNMVENKEVLLKEINHRVKNNLQVISSFISLTSIYSKDKQTLQTLNQRIQAISILYNSLYKPESNTNVNMQFYIEHICKEIFTIYTPNIDLSIQTNNIKFDFDKAISIGLLVNEIITNMIKHAFKGLKKAKIELNLLQENKTFILSIKDNGVGFDSSKNYESLGLKLIKRLSEKQLKGQLLIHSTHKGSTFTITFNNV